MKNPNVNCLEGMRCANKDCDAPFGPFQIECRVVAIVTDDGTEDAHDYEWGSDCMTWCQNCGGAATVGELRSAGEKEA